MGKRVQLNTNFFPVKFDLDLTIFHYDLQIFGAGPHNIDCNPT